MHIERSFRKISKTLPDYELQQLIKALFEIRCFDLLFNFSQIERNWIFENEKIYAETFWQLGRVEEYFNKVQDITSTLITFKYYAKFEQFYFEHEKRCAYRSFFKKARIMYLADMGQELQLLQYLEQTSIDEVYEILSTYDFEDPLLLKKVWLQKIKEQDRFQILPKELIEFLLLCDKDSEKLFVYEVDTLSDEAREAIVSIVKESLGYKLRDIPKEAKNLRKIFKVRKETFISQSPKTENFPKLYELEATPTLKIEKRNTYEASKEELKLITQFQYEQRDEIEIYELINSFIGMGYYKLALKLTDKLSLSNQKLYLAGFLSHKTGDNANCIYFINEYLNVEEPEDQAPFLKLKLRAHRELGNPDEVAKLSAQLQALGEDIPE